MKRAMIGVYQHDQIRNEETLGRTRVTDVAQRVAKLKWHWTSGAGMAISKRSVGSQWNGHTTSNESLGAPGNQWSRNVEFETLYGRLGPSLSPAAGRSRPRLATRGGWRLRHAPECILPFRITFIALTIIINPLPVQYR
ncbi:jg21259 [Pararge aegeria aegeria]|uniref:Jg21259 protein n=1 Tax=Pararge aegeria aegeria TaxID=348720 RepID=A0A8S4RGZ9_9NEOP|nr:jg21259 [Pararge aegeria aegeria]